VAWGRCKTEHSGPKRGRGYWGRKAEAKEASKRSRRREDRNVSKLGPDERIGRTSVSSGRGEVPGQDCGAQ